MRKELCQSAREEQRVPDEVKFVDHSRVFGRQYGTLFTPVFCA